MLNFKKVAVAFSVTAVLSSGAYIANEEYSKVALAIHLDDQSIGVKVKKGKVGDILSSQGIQINSFDRVEPGIDTQITKGETIKVFKARDIVIKDGDKEETRKTTYKKVGDILQELNIELGKEDRVSPSLDSEVQSVDTIKIVRVEKIEEKSTEEVKFETVEEKTDSLFVGEKSVKTTGKNGTKEIVKEIVKENGKKVSEKLVSETVKEEAVKEVVLVGTKEVSASNVVNAGYVPQVSNGNAAPAYYAPQPANYAPRQAYSGGALANGNTAGATGAYAAQQMAARTGVSAQTWEYIIARESNGQVNAYNPSGASGLFQTMPGWGSTATVDDQINAAVRAYNAQGLSAWGM